MIIVGESLVMVPFTPLNVTLVAPERFLPLMVTTVPTGPRVGLNVVMAGARVRQSAALVDPVEAVYVPGGQFVAAVARLVGT